MYNIYPWVELWHTGAQEGACCCENLSHVRLFATPWTIQSYSSPGQNTGVGSLSLLQGIFPAQVSYIAGRFVTSWATREAQEYWSGIGYPFSSVLSNPRLELGFPALQVDSLPTELWGKPQEGSSSSRFDRILTIIPLCGPGTMRYR